MPKHVLSREEAVARIAAVFRELGYEGASLSRISEATGLKSSSLYNYFPNGKEDMARAAIAHVAALLRDRVLPTLAGEGRPAARLAAYLQAIRAFYLGGEANCVLNVFSLGSAGPLFGDLLAAGVRRHVAALAALGEAAGRAPEEAEAAAETALAQIEGALVLSRATGSTAPFERALTRIPALLLPET